MGPPTSKSSRGQGLKLATGVSVGTHQSAEVTNLMTPYT
jgi:hypothetical protein